jgi:hypothetical protein
MDSFVESDFRMGMVRVAEVVSGSSFCVIAVPWDEVDSTLEMRRTK